jgi:EAL domain-containing protein (putative c-di-GMP-specific phosphodiesterase class I)
VSSAPLLDRVLAPDALSVRFQPVLRRTRTGGWRLHGLEGLVHGPLGTNAASAEVLFEYVRRKHAEDAVDRACITLVLTEAARLAGAPIVALNAHASTLGRNRGFLPFFEGALRAAGMPPSRIVIEVLEKSPVWDDAALRHTLDALRALGTRIALDDVGLGQSNMRMILECRPDYLKVDRYLVAGSSTDFYRRALLRSLNDLATSVGARVVAEGIEDHDDLATVLAEGITLVQGFLLARPMSAAALAATGLLEGGEIAPDPRGRLPGAFPRRLAIPA